MDYSVNLLNNLQNKVLSLRQDLSYDKKSTYVIKKLDPILFKTENYRKKIQIQFKNSDKFLQNDYTMIINKRLKGPRYKDDKTIIPHSVVCDYRVIESNEKRNKVNPKLSRQLSSSSFKSYNKNNSMLSTTKLKYTSNKKDELQNQIEKSSKSFISDSQIDYIYSKYSNYKKINLSNINNFLNEIPYDIRKKIMDQEKLLKAHEDYNNDIETISKRIQRKLKTSNSDLLLKNTDKSLLKKQAISLLKNNNTFQNSNVDLSNDWILNLRNHSSKRFNEVRFYPYGKDKWHMIREKPCKENEYTIHPGSYEKIPNKFYSNLNFKKIKFLKDMNQNLLEGQDLLKEELKLVKQLTGRKILHNRTEIDKEEIIIKNY